MTNNIFVALRERLDIFSIGFPKTKTGVEIKILQKLFSLADAELFLDMMPTLETPEAIAERSGRNLNKTADHLDRMAKQGLIFRHRKDLSVRYAASSFIVGSFEYQLTNIDRELAQLMEEYFDEGFICEGIDNNVMPLRTIPVQKSVGEKWNVAPYQNARQIVRSKKRIALADCICRTQHKLVDYECDKPLDVCMLFDSHADYYVENKIAKWITVEEALVVLDRCEEAGLVNQPASNVNPGGMCACCGDCCGVLRGMNKYPRPSELVTNNFWAKIDSDECDGCETCLDRCQMDAIVMNEEDQTGIKSERCIGCGLCVTTCPAECITLELKPEELRVEVSQSNMELALRTAEKRGVSIEQYFEPKN